MNQPKLIPGDRVTGGAGDDADIGTVDSVDGEQVTVRWDSLVTTTQSTSMLRRLTDEMDEAK